ncbi:MAG: alanine dehydrogenase, partial [Actinomycetota bacterium]
MRIAVPAEIKNNEYRVAITPAGVKDLVSAGHSVLIQAGAGLGSNITDDDYAKQGAEIE